MSLQARRELLFRIRNRYEQAGRREKTEILNGFVHATGYGRKHAIHGVSGGEKARKSGGLIRTGAQWLRSRCHFQFAKNGDGGETIHRRRRNCWLRNT